LPCSGNQFRRGRAPSETFSAIQVVNPTIWIPAFAGMTPATIRPLGFARRFILQLTFHTLMIGSNQEARFFGRRGFSSNIQASAETFPTYKTFFLPIYLSGQEKKNCSLPPIDYSTI
jgi:hypothetical protein